jgi:hypothetical protein
MGIAHDAAEMADRFEERRAETGQERSTDGPADDEISELRARVIALESDVADLARLVADALKKLDA